MSRELLNDIASLLVLAAALAAGVVSWGVFLRRWIDR